MDRSELPLGGKVAVVTGASGGVGKATAVAWANLGADLVVCARSDAPRPDGYPSLVDTRAEIEATGSRCVAVRVDVSVDEDIAELARRTRRGVRKGGHPLEQCGRPDPGDEPAHRRDVGRELAIPAQREPHGAVAGHQDLPAAVPSRRRDHRERDLGALAGGTADQAPTGRRFPRRCLPHEQGRFEPPDRRPGQRVAPPGDRRRRRPSGTSPHGTKHRPARRRGLRPRGLAGREARRRHLDRCRHPRRPDGTDRHRRVHAAGAARATSIDAQTRPGSSGYLRRPQSARALLYAAAARSAEANTRIPASRRTALSSSPSCSVSAADTMAKNGLVARCA